MKSILFLLKTFEIGGLEVVTVALANKFVAEGHRVSIVIFCKTESSIIDRLDERINTYTLHGFGVTEDNVRIMRTVMQEHCVDLLINQWGLPFVPIKVARRAAEGLNVKLISVYHNTPDMNGRIQTVQQEIDSCTSLFKRLVLKAKRTAFKVITAGSMRYNYYKSDAFVVLSPSFVDKFKEFAGIENPTKLRVQTNPVTIDTCGYEYDASLKLKEVVYVGRIDNTQKRTKRLVDVWKHAEREHGDWKLTIVGVGPDAEELKEYAVAQGVKNVSFEGYQHPRSYYERASILMLTSEFEGFPLVLAECMSFGVVPIVYNSYAAAGDIISDGVNGRLVDPKEGNFEADVFAEALTSIIENDDMRSDMAQAAIATAKEYSIDAIYGQWMNCVEKLYLK